MALPLCAAQTVMASRASLDGRGFPRFLAIDPTNILLFPGSGTEFAPQVLVDFARDYYSSYSPFPPPTPATSDRFVMGLAGKTLRVGYVLDGVTHNLVLSHPGGWGLSLGFADQLYEASRSFRHEEPDELSEFSNSQEEESSRRELRFNLGWRKKLASGRAWELGLGGGVVHATAATTVIVASTDPDTIEVLSGGWESGPGWGFDLRLRTLGSGPGFLGAGRFSYEDLRPEHQGNSPVPIDALRRSAGIDLGWRHPVDVLDDFVVGVSAEWSKSTEPIFVAYSQYVSGEERKATRYSGSLYASGERLVVGRLVVRAGVRGTGSFVNEETRRVLTTGSVVQETTSETSSGYIAPPDIFLGAGWSWESLHVDARISDSISLDTPFIRWTAALQW